MLTGLLLIFLSGALASGDEFRELLDTCGKFRADIEGDRNYSDFPWFASIYLMHTDYPTFLHASGATLVSKDLILAPESIFKHARPHLPDQYVVFLGETQLFSRIHTVQSRTIKEIISNPENQKVGAYADFVLLRLDQPVEFNEFVAPVCLCQEDTNWCELSTNQLGYVLNAEPIWTPSVRDPKTADIPHHFHRKSKIETTICGAPLSIVKVGNFTADFDHGLNTLICAEFNDESCYQQTRSSLYVMMDNRWYLKGANYIPTKPFSEHFDTEQCGAKGDKFGGFVDIGHLSKWIMGHAATEI